LKKNEETKTEEEIKEEGKEGSNRERKMVEE
jgi:hypothetical protein